MKLFYRQYGENKPLVILHGLFGQSDNWATLAKKMADSGIQAITVDLRNHGQSPHTNEMDYEMMAQDVFELMQELHLESPIILGHSMGGKVAMMLDRLYPGFLRQIIIADISPRQYPAGHTQVFEALNAVNFDVVKTRKDVELILRKFLNDEAVIQFLLKNVYWETPEKLNWRFNLKSIQNHYDKILASIPEYTSNTDALFIRGEQSHYIIDKDEELVKKYFPDSAIVTIPNAGHWVHAEQPQFFLEEVMKFLNTEK